MARNCFYSFQYQTDNWRASQVRNMGVIEGNEPVKDNDWETIKKGGDAAIQKWIDDQLSGRSCVVVLIGATTAGRHWINYEITKGWNAGKGVLGIHVHNLKDASGNSTAKGANPFDQLKFSDGRLLSTQVKVYDPPFTNSKDVYSHISDNLANWVESAIAAR